MMEEDLPFIYTPAFDDEAIEAKIQGMVEALGVQIIKEVKLIEIVEDEEDGLEAIVFKLLDVPEVLDDDEEDLEVENQSEDQGSNMGSGNGGTGENGSDNSGEQEADLVK